MLVRLLVPRSGPAGSQERFEQVEVSTDEGKRMIAAGQAEIVRTKKTEKAVKRSKVEKAAK